MKKGILLLIILILVLIIVGSCMIIMQKQNKKDNDITNNENIANLISPLNVENQNTINREITQNGQLQIVPTMSDEITEDAAWCGTFQLIWNDMKNEVVKKDIEFVPQEQIVENLNKEEFTTEMISEEYYFKTYGPKTLELKSNIENGIKQKFNQESDILDSINWETEVDNEYLFYSMLYRKFEYLKNFERLSNSSFGEQYDNIKYFGITNEAANEDEFLRSQIEVLYYNSKDDFAVILNTKTNDEVILCKNPEGNNFNEIYTNLNTKTEAYTGEKTFSKIDKLKVPYLTFNTVRIYEELQDKEFEDSEGQKVKINDAIQTIKFDLNENGGEIKSEALMTVVKSEIKVDEEEPRYFYVDDSFAIFLREEGKENPYFVAKIDDITKFQ